jgi:hypothetical protein
VDLPLKIVIFHSYVSLPEGKGVILRHSSEVLPRINLYLGMDKMASLSLRLAIYCHDSIPTIVTKRKKRR